MKTEEKPYFGLTEVQNEAVNAPAEGFFKIIAGAGSGKTEVLSRRLLSLIERGIRPDGIVAITFTNKAASELKRRLFSTNINQSLLRNIHISTFHSFLGSLIKRDPFGAGVDRQYSVLTGNERKLFIQRVLEKFIEIKGSEIVAGDDALGIETALKITNAFPGALEQIRKLLFEPADFFQAAMHFRNIQPEPATAFEKNVANWLYRFYSFYLQEMEEHRFLDFDDLLIRGRRLLASYKELGQRLPQKIFLIDEFQDNNREQLGIIKLFIDRDDGHLTVVGDPKQSIYRFQGADLETFMAFKADREDFLSENFRSVEEILTLADAFIEGPEDASHKLISNIGRSKRASPVACFVSEDPGGCKESEMIANFIQNAIQGHLGLQKKDRTLRYGDIAILVNSVRYMPKALEDALIERNIPYITSGGFGFYDRGEVQEVVAFLRLLADPNHDHSLAKILTGPLFGLSDKELANFAFGSRSEKTSLLTHLFSLPEEGLSNSVKTFRRLFIELYAWKDSLSVLELVYRILEEAGFREYAALQEQELKRIRMENNLKKLLGIVRGFEHRGIFTSLADFLQYLDRVLQSDIEEQEGSVTSEAQDAVKILTIHKAKGLEFPLVFLPFVKSRTYKESGTLHFTRGKGLLLRHDSEGHEVKSAAIEKFFAHEKEALNAESLRIFYVAITRAEELLVISGFQGNVKRPNNILQALVNQIQDKPFIGTVSKIDSWPDILSEWLGGEITPNASQVVEKATSTVDLSGLGEQILAIDRFLSVPSSLTHSKTAEEEIYSLRDLSLYEMCPRRFFYERRHLAPLIEPTPDVQTVLGNLVHHSLKLFHENNGSKLISEDRTSLMKKIFVQMLPLQDIMNEHVKDIALKILLRYLDSDISQEETWLLEAEVNLRLEASSGPFLLHGFCDRVDRIGQNIRVIDYKIRPFSSLHHHTYSDQMALYLASARRGILGDTNSLNFAEAVIVFLTTRSVTKVNIEPEVVKFENHAIEIVESLRINRQWEGKKGDHCKSCGHAVICA